MLVMSTVRWDRFVVVVDGLEWPTSTCRTQLRSVPDCIQSEMEWGHVVDQWHQKVAGGPFIQHLLLSGLWMSLWLPERHTAHFQNSSYYVDANISITSGNPWEHLWTYAASLQENFSHSNGRYEYPCATGSTQTVPSFVLWVWLSRIFWLQHILYRSSVGYGEQCGAIKRRCCRVTGLPWLRHYPLPPVTTLNWDSAVIRILVMKMFLLACMRFTWNNA